MDVQTLAPTAAQGLPPDPSGGTLPQGTLPAVPPVQSLAAAQPAGNADPSQAPAKAPAPLQLPHEIAKIFAGGASQVTISFQVAHSPNEIVTVFKNSVTGEIISQVPSEIMIKVAEFFDQIAGVVLDKSA